MEEVENEEAFTEKQYEVLNSMEQRLSDKIDSIMSALVSLKTSKEEEATPKKANVESTRGSSGIPIVPPTPFHYDSDPSTPDPKNNLTKAAKESRSSILEDSSSFSMLGRNFPSATPKTANSGEGTVAYPTPQLVMNMQLQSHDNIKLNSLDMKYIPSFIVALREYTVVNSFALPPSSVLSKGVLNLLANSMSMSSTDFGASSHTTLFKALQKSIDLRDEISFVSALRSSLQLVDRLSWEQVTPANHELFFRGILFRKERFLSYFSFLLEANPSSCPTRVSKKEGCVPLFLNLFDEYYVASCLLEMPAINNANYDNKVTKFIDKFVSIAASHYELSKNIKRVPYSAKGFVRPVVDPIFNPIPSDKEFDRKTQVKSAATSESMSARSNMLKNKSSLWSHQSSQPRRSDRIQQQSNSNFKPRSSLHHIAEVSPIDQEEDSYIHHLCNQPDVHPSYGAYATVEEDEIIQTPDQPDSDFEALYGVATEHSPDTLVPNERVTNEHISNEQRVAFVAAQGSNASSASSKPSLSYGCLHYGMHGTCPRGDDCHFKAYHNREGAIKAHAYLESQINAQRLKWK